MPRHAPVHRLPPRDEFLVRYRISEQDYENTGLRWAELQSIFDDYHGWYDNLPKIAEGLSSILRRCPAVHVARCRAKNPEKLIAKIIRRSIEEESRWASRSNYVQVVPDLIGLRAIYLMNEQWPEVHRFIRANFPVRRNPKPTAYIQPPIPTRIRSAYENGGLKIKTGKHGYQSIHYEMRHQVGKYDVRIEIQARTLYQEAWGEISHVTAYPYRTRVALLTKSMLKLASLTAKADYFSSAVDKVAQLWDARTARRMPSSNLVDSYMELLDFLSDNHPEIAEGLRAASTEFSIGRVDETFRLPPV